MRQLAEDTDFEYVFFWTEIYINWLMDQVSLFYFRFSNAISMLFVIEFISWAILEFEKQTTNLLDANTIWIHIGFLYNSDNLFSLVFKYSWLFKIKKLQMQYHLESTRIFFLVFRPKCIKLQI